jgi:hypothetical protein
VAAPGLARLARVLEEVGAAVTPRGASQVAEARSLIGRRVRFGDESEHGTIVNITMSRNGYLRYVVQWDAGAPDWWGTEVAPGNLVLESDR